MSACLLRFSFFFNDTATTEIYTLSLHDALPICKREQFSGFNRTLDAINNVFRKFSAFHDETGRLNVDGMNIISNDGSNKRPVSSWKALNLRKTLRSEERFSRNAETDIVCRLLLEKKKNSTI